MNPESFMASITQSPGVPVEQTLRVVTATLEELHRLALDEDHGLTDIAQSIGFSAGGIAAAHFLGLVAAIYDYSGHSDDTAIYDETAARFVPDEYEEVVVKVRVWLAERSETRKRYDAIRSESGS